MAAYDIPTAVHRAVLAGTDRIPTPRAQEGEVSTPLSEAERSVVDRIEQAPDAPEALRERVAEAIHDGDGSRCRHGWLNCPRAPKYRRMADAAIEAIRGAR